MSAHFVDEEFDTGDLVRVDRFPIDREAETALSLDIRSQERLLAVFRGRDRHGAGGPGAAARAPGRGPLRDARGVRGAAPRCGPDDPPELTERRIRAFWYPPFDGATIEVGGRTLTLVDRSLLAQAAVANRDAGLLP